MVNVSGHVGRNVSGVVDAAVTGSSPLMFDGMQVLSLKLCHRVVSQVPRCPLSQLCCDAHTEPMLQMPACVHAQANTAASPVGWPPLQPIPVGIVTPFGCVTAHAGADERHTTTISALARMARLLGGRASSSFVPALLVEIIGVRVCQNGAPVAKGND